jgi:hypothetical protein
VLVELACLRVRGTLFQTFCLKLVLGTTCMYWVRDVVRPYMRVSRWGIERVVQVFGVEW